MLLLRKAVVDPGLVAPILNIRISKGYLEKWSKLRLEDNVDALTKARFSADHESSYPLLNISIILIFYSTVPLLLVPYPAIIGWFYHAPRIKNFKQAYCSILSFIHSFMKIKAWTESDISCGDQQKRWFKESFHQILNIKSSFSGIKIQFVRDTFHMLLDTLITSPLDSTLTPSIHYGQLRARPRPVRLSMVCANIGRVAGPGPCIPRYTALYKMRE